MLLKKYIEIIILSLLLLTSYGGANTYDLESYSQYFLNQIESIKKSVEILNTRLDIINQGSALVEKNLKIVEQQVTPSTPSCKANSNITFDIRYDSLPKHCSSNALFTSCAQATACTSSSGIYNITVPRYNNKVVTAFCDQHNFDGDWLYILKRQDGSIDFNRSWNHYLEGFGDVAGEYWIGLENLYALTNFNGPQELNVFIEDFDGKHVFARYDNFVVGNASEKYKLKSLGRYWGTAGDSMFGQIGAHFSTYDSDSDTLNNKNCAYERRGGFWFTDCTKANPTGKYLRGTYTKLYEGSYWRTFNGENYSQKTIIFMIRRQRTMIVNFNK
ncbi:hypothetical protein DOY81_005815 [Sarcophaga bullata]|nr:hypothetical protein DOY81_005815 [Sarcophaga bullata]